MSARRSMPPRRQCVRQAVRIRGQRLYLDVGRHATAPQTVGEVFIIVEKTGSEMRALLDTVARLISLGLQHGIPLTTYVEMLLGTKFHPAGPVTGDPRIRLASSPLDYVAKHLGVNYCGMEDLAHLPAIAEGP